MQKSPQYHSLEDELLFLQKEATNKSLTIEDILHILSGKGRPLLILLLALPFCQPLQIPGLSTPFGLVIAFFGLRMAFGKKVWLPKSLLRHQLSSQLICSITNKTMVLIKKLKPWLHERVTWMCTSTVMEICNGLAIFSLGLLLALPLPIPLSNLTAAWSIFLITLGVMREDGLFVTIGYVVFLIALFALAFVVLTVKNILWV